MRNHLLPSILFLLCISCASPKNSEDFISETTGRYLFNANEVLEVYFKEKELFIKWRGREDIQPLKVNDSSFYMKELNEKIIFVGAPKIHIKLAEKTEHKGVEYLFSKMKPGEKTPTEYFEAKNYNKALKAFLEIKKQDSLSPVIRQYTINRTGYNYMKNNEFEKAIEILKINTQLYPKSSNTFDSLGDAYLEAKDTVNAIDNYNKSLSINSENSSSLRMLKKITEK
ncbi:hypothetical protein CW731_01945 [Polaribacter sp. ALD11]|uniref:tetratricopeptide repeat protein n=1 Tax=Polaribacter sp. ALD11 TaxID=2058137 RepID=UPI000C319721|nr:hypothetical protein [Polaribacter sp. ALD11]AUC84132.1 hypothetical protein CW731_01945 [Polaribacter sp. ALD11]